MAKKSNWEIRENHLCKSFAFKDFREAMAAMLTISYIAEELNHHPEWCNVYNKLDIRLTTHDTGGISEKDHELAMRIDALNLCKN
jgi:4a-hydroxytetrahydrobiopterin dehydratase